MFTLAHLSDLHLTSLAHVRPSWLVGKRAFGYLSWRIKRRARHRPEIVAALRKDLASMQPDHVAITGDMTHLGLPTEFADAATWLAQTGSPEWVTLVPGNHDAYGPARWEDTFARWGPYMKADGGAVSPDMFPTLRIRSPLALIGLSTAHPSPLFAAIGSLGERQIEALAALLIETGRQGFCRVVLMHHPPLPHIVSWRRRLTDADAFAAVLHRCGAELVLHGHTHRTAVGGLAGPDEQIPVVGVRSGSEIGHKPGRRAEYHLYRVAPRAGGWSIDLEARSLVAGALRFGAAGDECG